MTAQRFSGPQVLRFREKHPDAYKATSRISLVSSFLASLFLGKIAPIDIGDVCGMNLWDINSGTWHEALLSLAAGGEGAVSDLKQKLGSIPEDGGASFGSISHYFVSRFNFSSDCAVIPFTGDNPATILSLPLRASDAIVSLGTSTTFLMSTPQYKPDVAYHLMNHPTISGLYMFMLCYKNGGLAREQIRDALNRPDGKSKSWDRFNETATSSPPLGQPEPGKGPMKMGLFFPLPEIVPNVRAGTWRFLHESGASESALREVSEADEGDWPLPETDVRAILESQFLSLRLRSQGLVQPQSASDGTSLPPQPRRIYLVGGGALNSAIAKVCGEVLGGAEGVFRLDIGGNACALGAAYKAVWGVERGDGGKETFEELIGKRWKEEGFVGKVADGYKKGLWEMYGEALQGFAEVEGRVSEVAGEGRGSERMVKEDQGVGSSLSEPR